jgi:hypothetical protein
MWASSSNKHPQVLPNAVHQAESAVMNNSNTVANSMLATEQQSHLTSAWRAPHSLFLRKGTLADH